MLLVTCLYVAYQAKDQLGLLIAIGVTALLFTHIFMNASMTISLMPIAGLPLPIISYGGTFVMIIMFALGLVQSVWIHRKTVRRGTEVAPAGIEFRLRLEPFQSRRARTLKLWRNLAMLFAGSTPRHCAPG